MCPPFSLALSSWSLNPISSCPPAISFLRAHDSFFLATATSYLISLLGQGVLPGITISLWEGVAEFPGGTALEAQTGTSFKPGSWLDYPVVDAG